MGFGASRSEEDKAIHERHLEASRLPLFVRFIVVEDKSEGPAIDEDHLEEKLSNALTEANLMFEPAGFSVHVLGAVTPMSTDVEEISWFTTGESWLPYIWHINHSAYRMLSTDTSLVSTMCNRALPCVNVFIVRRLDQRVADVPGTFWIDESNSHFRPGALNMVAQYPGLVSGFSEWGIVIAARRNHGDDRITYGLDGYEASDYEGEEVLLGTALVKGPGVILGLPLLEGTVTAYSPSTGSTLEDIQDDEGVLFYGVSGEVNDYARLAFPDDYSSDDPYYLPFDNDTRALYGSDWLVNPMANYDNDNWFTWEYKWTQSQIRRMRLSYFSRRTARAASRPDVPDFVGRGPIGGMF